MSDWKAALSGDDRARLTKAPPPSRIEPMLATLTERRFSDPDWIFERKLDGERILAVGTKGSVRLKTRNDKTANAAYPEIVDALEDQDAQDFVVDGEVVAFAGSVTSFSRLQKRMQIKSEREARASGVSVYYYLFDLIRLDRISLEDLPLRRRKAILKTAFAFADPIRFTAHRNASGEAFFKDACDKGWEGLIAKKAQSGYVHKRSSDWLKFKCVNGQGFVIGVYSQPHGSRVGFGALVLG